MFKPVSKSRVLIALYAPFYTWDTHFGEYIVNLNLPGENSGISF